MFGLFKKKTEKEKLQEQYKKMMEKSFQLSTTNRKESDIVRAEAEKIALQIEKLE